MRRLYLKFLRLFNRGEPSVTEVQYVLLTSHRLTDEMSLSRMRVAIILCRYSIGESLEHIADVYGVTRERIRQTIRKACRECHT